MNSWATKTAPVLCCARKTILAPGDGGVNDHRGRRGGRKTSLSLFACLRHLHPVGVFGLRCRRSTLPTASEYRYYTIKIEPAKFIIPFLFQVYFKNRRIITEGYTKYVRTTKKTHATGCGTTTEKKRRKKLSRCERRRRLAGAVRWSASSTYSLGIFFFFSSSSRVEK